MRGKLKAFWLALRHAYRYSRSLTEVVTGGSKHAPTRDFGGFNGAGFWHVACNIFIALVRLAQLLVELW